MNAAELQFIVKAQDQASATIGSIGSSFADMGSIVKDQVAAMQALTAALTGSTGKAKEAASATHEHAAAHKEAGESAKQHEEAELGLGRALERVANQAKEAAEAMIGLWASNEMAKATVEAAQDTEHAINSMARASGLAKAQIREFHEELAKISIKNGYATIEQMDEMAAQGFRMGGSAEQVANFTQKLSMIGKGADLKPITEGVRMLLESTGEGIDGVDKLTEALAALESKSKSGITGLLPLMEMLTSRTGDLHLSSEQLAAYAATFEKLGGRPERFVEGFAGSVRALKKAAEDGSQGLNILAQMAGVSADAFNKLSREHPEEAFMKLLSVVKKLQDEGQDPAALLSRIGIGPEQVAGVEALAKQYDVLAEKQKLAANPPPNSAKALGDSLNDDFDKSVTSLTTAWTEFKSAVGEDMLGPLTTAFNGLSTVLTAVTDFMGMLDVNTRRMAEGFVIGATGVFGIIKVFGEFFEILSGVKEALLLTGNTAVQETARTGAAIVASVAETGAAVVEETAATEAKLVEIGEAGAAAATTAGAGMLSSFAMKALAITAIIASIHETMEGIGTLMDQADARAKQGASGWGNYFKGIYGLATGDTKPLQDSMQADKDAARDPKKNDPNKVEPTWGDYGFALFHSQKETQARMQDRLGDQRQKASEDKAKETESGGEDHSITAREKSAQVLSDETFKTLQGYDGQLKKLADIQKIQDAITEAEKIKSGGGELNEVDKKVVDRLNLTKQRLAYETMMADPLQAQARAMGDAALKAAAFTKAQQDALEVSKAIRDMEEKGQLDASTPDDAAHSQAKANLQAPQQAATAKAFQEQLIAMRNQLALAGALTKADRDRLEIDQQLAALQKNMGLDTGQLAQLDAILTKTKEIEDRTAQFKSLNPQANALKEYNAQLEILNKNRATMGEPEYNREKTKLDQDTLGSRDPLGKIAQDEKEEIAQLAIVGQYREADLKTLQQITDLKHQGIDLTKAEADQLSTNNRHIQDVKDTQKQMDDLTQTFGSGLSNAISGALAGNKHAFSQFGLSLGKKMMDSAFANLSKSVEGSMQGMFGGMFGAANDNADKLIGHGKDQAESTIKTANATVQAANVYVNGAVQGAKDATANATEAGAAPGLPAAGSPGSIYGNGGPTQGGLAPFGNLGASAQAFTNSNTTGAAPSSSLGGFYAAARMHETRDQNIPNAAGGGAGGYYQFMPGTWSGIRKQHPELGLPETAMAGTKDQQTAAYQAFTKGNVDQLSASGVPINDKNTFMASFLGAGGASKFIKDRDQNPNAGAASLFPKEAASNRTIFYNKDGSEKSLDQVYGGMTHSFGNTNTTGFGPNSQAPHPSAIAAANDPVTKSLVEAGKTAQAQFETAAKAGGTSLKTELTKANTDIGADFKTKITDATGTTDKLSPDAASSPNAQPAVDPTATASNSGGDAGGLLGGLTSLAGKIPGAAPYAQGAGLLEKLLGGLFGGGGGGLGSLFSALHTGGLVGRPTAMARYVNPTIFNGAARFHDGLGDDEFPAILQRGERVLTANQDQRATAMMSRMADMIANSNASTPAGTQRPDSGRQQNGRSVIMNISTPNAGSFRHSQSQIMASQHAALQRMGNKHN